MAHQVEQMFSVKQTPWHGLGHIIQEAPTAEEAIKLAGLNWNVQEQSIYRIISGQPEKVESHKMLIRDDNDKQLGIVGKDYAPLQNDKAFQFFNPFIESGLAQFETAGCLREGKTVWVLAKLNKAPIEIGKGDQVAKFLLLSNGHDGSMAVRVGFTPIRVVCANTLAMSHEAGESKLLRFFHSKQVNQRLDAVQEIINAADAKFEATAEQYRALAKADVDQKALSKYVEIVFKFSAIEEARRQMAKDRITQDITRLFETGRGQDLKGAKGTYWGLYNAVTELLSYEKGRTEDSRLNSLWFGDSKLTNKRALETALEMVVA
jgi:phage/plasmid-like protein (TIGR03299 family)